MMQNILSENGYKGEIKTMNIRPINILASFATFSDLLAAFHRFG
jgi:hypothetical protein